jgi:hypothetical protein
LGALAPALVLPEICFDKNVVVPRSKRVEDKQNASERALENR